MKIGRLLLGSVSRFFLAYDFFSFSFSLTDSEMVCEKTGNTGEVFPLLGLPVIVPSAC